MSFVLSLGCFGMAWRMTALGASGAEDIPPPFILVAGLAGVALLLVSVVGRYPWPASNS
ncbi:hypothetical protein [Arenimonas sp.]|uniref:hypothetical protein n=1 Tax=Arenimonas sp. TaxID=1872635 RepID=UPI0039E28FE9